MNGGFRPFLRYLVSDLEEYLKDYPSQKMKDQVIFELSHRKTSKSKILLNELTSKNLNPAERSRLESSHYKIIGENLNICKAWERGKTKKELQKKYKISRNYISIIIKKGIDKKEVSDQKRKQIKLDKIKTLKEEKLKKKQLKAKTLTEKEKIILNYRISGLTLEEIGQYYDVSRERIRQILAKIKKKGFDMPRTAGIVQRKKSDLKNKQITDGQIKTNSNNFIKEYKKNLSDKETAKNLNLSLKNFKFIAELFIQEGRMNRRLKIFDAEQYAEMKKEWDEIAKMRKAGYLNHKIASILDTSSQMISIKLERMKSNGYIIRPNGNMIDRDYSDDYDEETIAYRTKVIKELNNKGLAKSQIAKKLGLGNRDIYRHIGLYMINY